MRYVRDRSKVKALLEQATIDEIVGIVDSEDNQIRLYFDPGTWPDWNHDGESVMAESDLFKKYAERGALLRMNRVFVEIMRVIHRSFASTDMYPIDSDYTISVGNRKDSNVSDKAAEDLINAMIDFSERGLSIEKEWVI